MRPGLEEMGYFSAIHHDQYAPGFSSTFEKQKWSRHLDNGHQRVAFSLFLVGFSSMYPMFLRSSALALTRSGETW